MDTRTSRDIDKAVARLLREAGIREPPVHIADVLEHVRVHRQFYNLEDPTLLQRFWHRVKVESKVLVDVVRRIRLTAVWLPDESRILIDESAPPLKQDWASFHDAIHS